LCLWYNHEGTQARGGAGASARCWAPASCFLSLRFFVLGDHATTPCQPLRPFTCSI
jgi:hypothetical protein